ncbi:MAG: hypothetical protein ACREKA_12055 [Candidatus Methylomirabilales bacterium]
MLRLLFEFVQSLLGSSLRTVALWLYAAAAATLALAWLLPPVRLVLARVRARAGAEEGLFLRCPQCATANLPEDPQCLSCGRPLRLPFFLRARARLDAAKRHAWVRRTRLAGTAVGLLAFYALTLTVVLTVGFASPGSDLMRLVAAGTVLAMLGATHLFRAAFSLDGRGILPKLSQAALGLGLLGATVTGLFLSTATAPAAPLSLGELRLDGRMVRFNDLTVAVPDDSITLEYLQLDHALLGYHQIVLLALSGSERREVPHGPFVRRLLTHLVRHTDWYDRRGLEVRLRADRRGLAPGTTYRVLNRGRQLSIRPAS